MRSRTIPVSGSVAPMLATIACLLLFTACGSKSSNTVTATDGNPTSVNSSSPVANTSSPEKAKPTDSPQVQNKTMPAAANAPNSQIGSGGNDFFLFTKARSVLDSDADLKKSNITIDVKAGIVTLSGAVTNAELKSKAEQLVRGAEGVKAVTNRLRITN